jgi:hypothetical protein
VPPAPADKFSPHPSATATAVPTIPTITTISLEDSLPSVRDDLVDDWEFDATPKAKSK